MYNTSENILHDSKTNSLLFFFKQNRFMQFINEICKEIRMGVSPPQFLFVKA